MTGRPGFLRATPRLPNRDDGCPFRRVARRPADGGGLSRRRVFGALVRYRPGGFSALFGLPAGRGARRLVPSGDRRTVLGDAAERDELPMTADTLERVRAATDAIYRAE